VNILFNLIVNEAGIEYLRGCLEKLYISLKLQAKFQKHIYLFQFCN